MSKYSKQLEQWKKRREVIYKEHYIDNMSLHELAKKYNISIPQVCELIKKHKKYHKLLKDKLGRYVKKT